MKLKFTPRNKLSNYEWDPVQQRWNRARLDRDVLNELTQGSTLNGLWRLGIYVFCLVGSAVAAVTVSRYNIWLSIPLFYVYFFFIGFLVPISHELQHRMVFAKSANWLSDCVYFVVQTLVWNSPRYARISHRLHHRYTMVRGLDPETDWQGMSSKWLRNFVWKLVLDTLVVGAIVTWFREVWRQILRIAGVKDKLMQEHCTDSDIKVIRIESSAILLIHATVLGASIWFRRWEPIALVTLAWQIGNPFEFWWHQTEHIGRIYNVNDQRLCTRSVKVGPVIKLFYWGLDDHVEHHMYPGVPSRNLPKLHEMLKKDLPEAQTMFECWKEMFAIAKEKDQNPDNEFVPIPL